MEHMNKKAQMIDNILRLGCLVILLSLVVYLCMSTPLDNKVSATSAENLVATSADEKDSKDVTDSTDETQLIQSKIDGMNFGVLEGEADEEEQNGEESNLSDVEKQLIEKVGLDPEMMNADITQSGGVLISDVARTVKNYKTLAEAEEDMGYYLGLHNIIESQPSLVLTGMYSIGKGEWYQALFEDESEKINNITIKTSMSTPLDDLTAPYNVGEFKSVDVKTIDDVDVTFGCKEGNSVNLVWFNVPNGKSYTIYTSVGNEYSVMEDIVTELIKNLKIMDDWKD